MEVKLNCKIASQSTQQTDYYMSAIKLRTQHDSILAVKKGFKTRI